VNEAVEVGVLLGGTGVLARVDVEVKVLVIVDVFTGVFVGGRGVFVDF
jgi:hypothetical protein